MIIRVLSICNIGIRFTNFSSQEVFKGQLIYDKILSSALERNKLGDSAEREITIYLPTSYDNSSDETQYPVLYLLHGYSGNNRLWTGQAMGVYSDVLIHIDEIADELIKSGQMEEMIIVMPDGSNKLGGSMYVNSELSGNYEIKIIFI